MMSLIYTIYLIQPFRSDGPVRHGEGLQNWEPINPAIQGLHIKKYNVSQSKHYPDFRKQSKLSISIAVANRKLSVTFILGSLYTPQALFFLDIIKYIDITFAQRLEQVTSYFF